MQAPWLRIGWVGASAVAALAVMVLTGLAIDRGAIPVLSVSDNPMVARTATHQILVLPLAGLFVWLGGAPARRRFFRHGDLRAPARAVPLLGIKAGQSWITVALPFAFIVTAVTVLFLWETVEVESAALLVAHWPFVLLFAASNAFSEEVFARYHLAAHLDGHLPPGRIAALSALVFGLPHWFGTPGGPVGAGMAAFLGWLLCKAVLETRGMAYAWAIHALQDVAIFSVLFAAAATMP